MMRLCCLSLSFKPEFADKRLDAFKFIQLCDDLRLDGVDFNLASFDSLERDYLRRVKTECLRRGLTIACIGISNNFGRPAADQASVVADIRRGIDVAQFLGAPVVRLFAGSVSVGQPRDEVWQRCVNGLRAAAAYGDEAGIAVAIQNHNHGNVAATGDDILKLLKDVNHANFTHMLDTGQYLGSPGASGARPDDGSKHDVYRSIEQTAPHAVFVRAKLYRLRNGREQWLDYDRIFAILRRVRYNGFVSLVYEGWEDQDATHAVPIGVQFLRGYLIQS